VRDVLFYAQMRGNAQGFAKILEGTVGHDPQAGAMTVVAALGATIRIDGARNPGMVVCRRAADEAARLAQTHGVGLASAFNIASSTGALGYYAGRLAETGIIGIVMAGSPKVMAAHGGVDPVFGTNPIAIAVPTGTTPLVFDMATSATTLFDVIAARDRGGTLDEGAAVDADGAATTDPLAALAGALLPFAGHKGSGLALMIEILTGPLTGAAIAGDDDARVNRGVTAIAIAPSFLVDENAFRARVDALCRTIRSGRTLTGLDITLPGDRGNFRAETSAHTATIPIDADQWRRLQAFAAGAPSETVSDQP